ncbi:MAG: OsmC family protein [Chloroflexota bacterium]|nr:OsmC family protein [Chloroflexota bacterium]
MATVTVRNGIDVDQLIATIGAIQQQPSISTFTFKATTTWENGTLNRGEIGEFIHNGERVDRPQPFRLTGDEPPVLLGSNSGPNAVELVLAALGFCYGVGYVANAAARGIELSELRYEVEGDIDVQNFLGMTKETRPGFSAIRARAWVRSPNATPEQLEELCDYVQATSPVRDVLANPVPVDTSLEVLS